MKKLTIFLIFSLFSFSLRGMGIIKDKLISKFYRTGTNTIDFIAEGSVNSAAWLIHTIHRKNKKPINYPLYEDKARNKIASIHNKLLDEEEHIINNIYDTLNLSEDKRKEVAEQMNQEQEFATDYMQQSHDEIRHEISLSNELAEHIFQTTHINPKSVNLFNIKEDNLQEPDASASAHSLSQDIYHKTITPPYIKIYPKMDLQNTDAILLHEFAHLAAHHTIIINILDTVIINHSAISKIKKARGFWEISREDYNMKQGVENHTEKLRINHERQAEILFKNAKTAEVMRASRKKCYYPNTLFLNHYAQLTQIDELHKFPEKLKNYKLVPIQKVPDLKHMKFAFNAI